MKNLTTLFAALVFASSAMAISWTSSPPSSVLAGQSYSLGASHTQTATTVVVYIYKNGSQYNSGGTGGTGLYPVTASASCSSSDSGGQTISWSAEGWSTAYGTWGMNGSVSGSTTVIANRSPSASISGSTSLTVGQTGSWSFGASDPDGNLYRWRFHSSSNPNPQWSSASGGSVSGSYSTSFSSPGSYGWVVDVEDTGGASDSSSITVSVSALPASFSFSGGPTFTYDGSPKSVSATPSPSGATYSTGGTYSATNVGSYTATASATGNYSGSGSYNWSIVPKSASFSFSGGPFTYDGSSKSVSVSASPSGATYSTAGTSATNAGSYTATASANGNYSGSGSYDWTINPKPISSFSFSGGPSFTYDGGSKSVSVSVTPSGATYATSGTWSASAVGNYTATVTGTGNYSGSSSYSWSIDAAPPPVASFTFSGGPSFTYDGAAKSVAVSVSPAGAPYTTSGTYSAVNVGNYTAYATASGGYTGSGSKAWEIKPATASFTFSGGPSCNYDGTSKSVSVAASPAGATYSTSGTWSASAVGTYTATVTATGNYTGSQSFSWSIVSQTPAITAHPQNKEALQGETVTFAVTATGPSLNYQWHKNGSNIAGATSSTITLPNVVLADNGNYNVTVSNNYGGVTSQPASLTVNEPPIVLGLSVNVVSASEIQMTAQARDTKGDLHNFKFFVSPPPSYDGWDYVEAQTVAPAYDLTLTDVWRPYTPLPNGTYYVWVRVWDGANQIDSNGGAFTSFTIGAGSPISLSVSPYEVANGDDLSVTYSGAGANSWIGLYNYYGSDANPILQQTVSGSGGLVTFNINSNFQLMERYNARMFLGSGSSNRMCISNSFLMVQAWGVTVVDGTGGASAVRAGTVLNIVSNPPPTGEGFVGWTITEGPGVLGDPSQPATTFTTGEGYSIVRANYSGIPQFSGSFTATGDFGHAFTFTLNASNSPTSFTAANLPAGLSLQILDNPKRGVISGTPTEFGTFTIPISASNAAGSGYGLLTLQIRGSDVDSDNDGIPNGWELAYGLNPDSASDALQDPDGDGMTSVAEYHLNLNPRVYNEGTSTLGSSVPAGWTSLVEGNAVKTTAVGSTTATLEIDKNGAATYSIPIEVPPGTAGLQPHLALTYSSSAGEGIAGYGWTISGISTITRGGQTRATDGKVGGINFNADDRFYLDGQRLMAVAGADGGINTEYRTETETFTKVVSYGSAGTNGPEYFQAWTKSGLTVEYGKNSLESENTRVDAEPVASQSPGALSWSVSKMTDRAGNYMTFTYAWDATNREQRIASIHYTKRAGSQLDFYGSVVFDYETDPRPDRRMLFTAGSRHGLVSRLKKIVCSGPGGVARVYTLAYKQQGVTGWSLLESVTESDGLTGAGHAYEPLTFHYTEQEIGDLVWSDLPAGFKPPMALSNASGFIDLNNDGRLDFVEHQGQLDMGSVYFNTDTGFVKEPDQSSWHLPMNLAWSSYDMGARFLDLNGDGRVDLMSVMETDQMAWTNSGAGWTRTPAYDPPVFLLFDNHRPVGGTIADVDGDGLPDIVLSRAGGNRNGVYRNTGSGWTSTPVPGWTVPVAFSDDNDVDRGVTMVDLNGDGLPDILQGFAAENPNPNEIITWMARGAWLNTGSGWVAAPQYLPPLPLVRRNYSLWGVELIDLNGDRLPDFVCNHWNGVTQYTGTWLNTGNGWFQDTSSASQTSTLGYNTPFQLGLNTAGTGSGGRVRAASPLVDLNRDGLPDQFWLRGLPNAAQTGINFMHSNGFGGTESAASFATAPCFFAFDLRPEIGAQLVDLDADGAPDLVWNIGTATMPGGYESSGALRNAAPRPNLLKEAIDGFGNRTVIQYAPLTERSDGNYSVYDPAPPGVGPAGSIDVVGPMHVVKCVTRDNGIGGTYDVTYRYGGLRSHLKYGGLGFDNVSQCDERSGVVTTTSYRQDYPYIGLPKSRVTIAPTESGGTQTVLSVATTYGKKELNSGKTRFIFPRTVTTTKTDLNGEVMATSETTTQRGTETQSDDYDDYGNAKYTSVTSGDGYSRTTINTYDNITELGKWLLGELRTSTTTAVGPNVDPDIPASMMRKVGYTYQENTGWLETMTVEPDDTNAENPQRMVTTYGYDDFGNQDSITVAGGGLTDKDGTAADRTTQGHFDERGRFPEWSEDALMHRTDYGYDQNLGLVTSITDPNGLPTIYGYDRFGHKNSETRSDGTTTSITRLWSKSTAPGGSAVYHVVTDKEGAAPSATFHDTLGRPVYTFGINGGSSQAGRPAIVGRRTEYDEFGRPYRSSLPFYYSGSIAGSNVTTGVEVTLYDSLDRPRTESHKDDEVDRSSFTITYTYEGLKSTQTDGRGHRTDTILNLQGKLARAVRNATAASGSDDRGEVRYSYDPFGNLRKTKVVKAEDDMLVTQIGYDTRGRKISLDDPNVGSRSYRYNAAGELVWQHDAEGNVTTMRYDQLGRCVLRHEDEGDTVWGYDTSTHETPPEGAPATWLGKLASVTSPSEIGVGYQETYSYDSLGREKKVVRRIDGADFETQQFYDAYSRPTILTYPNGYQVKNVYNPFGFLSEVRQASAQTLLINDTVANQVFWQASGYSIWGQANGAQLGNGLVESVTYSGTTGRIRRIDHGLVGISNISNYSYTYDAAGDVVTRSDDAPEVKRVESFEYDGLNRLTSATLTVGTGGFGVSGSQSVGYDPYGNITNKTGVGTFDYYPEAKNRVKSVTGGSLQPATTFNYSDNGNMRDGAGRSMQWTVAGQVKRIDGPGSYSQFSFGAKRERVLQQTGATKTIYVGSMYEKATTNGVAEHRYYVFTPMGRIAVRTETGGAVATRYLHSDMLGSISAVTDEFGKVVQRFAYDPWGRRTAQVSGATCNRGFTDHEHLDELGLVHMNARVYDPVIARFLSADPIVDGADDAQGYNRYSYVKNNPLRMVDPSGNEGELPEFNATIGHMDLTFGTFGSGSYTGQWGGSSLTGAPAFFGGWQSNYSGLAPFGSSLLNGNSLSEAFKTGIVGPLGVTAWDFHSFDSNVFGPDKTATKTVAVLLSEANSGNDRAYENGTKTKFDVMFDWQWKHNAAWQKAGSPNRVALETFSSKEEFKKLFDQYNQPGVLVIGGRSHGVYENGKYADKVLVGGQQLDDYDFKYTPLKELKDNVSYRYLTCDAEGERPFTDILQYVDRQLSLKGALPETR